MKNRTQNTYYGGDEEAPILSKNFDEFTRIDCWQEYAYVLLRTDGCYSIRQNGMMITVR